MLCWIILKPLRFDLTCQVTSIGRVNNAQTLNVEIGKMLFTIDHINGTMAFKMLHEKGGDDEIMRKKVQMRRTKFV